MTSIQAAARLMDIVLPIVEVSGTPPNLKYERLLGSGFLIAESNYLLTAAHVLRAGQPGYAVALRVVGNKFETVNLGNPRFHPSEDVAICTIEIKNHVKSWFKPIAEPHFQSKDCHVWGYPTDVLYDGGERSADGRYLQRPELVFTKGYVRRRISFGIMGIMGYNFYEINDSAGDGCSGGPLVIADDKNYSSVIGIYIGEQLSEQSGKPLRSRGYAVRMDAVFGWLKGLIPDPT